jgi:hypothetical protein
MINHSKNIKLNYLYRDSGNYKIFSSEIFRNPENIPLDEIKQCIKSILIEGEFFEPLQWNLKRLCFNDFHSDQDHLWNEFESVEYTSIPVTMDQTIGRFLEHIKSIKN